MEHRASDLAALEAEQVEVDDGKRSAAPKSRRRPIAKQKWTLEEEAALKDGVAKYGIGKWRQVQQDPVFGPALERRSNVDLKDKWRNLQMDLSGPRRQLGPVLPEELAQSMPGGRKRRRTQERSEAKPDRAQDESHRRQSRRRMRQNSKYSGETTEAEHDDSENYASDASQQSTFSTDMTRAAILVLQTSRRQPVDLELIIEWLQTALHRPAINEDAVAKKLEDLAERNMVKEQDGRWCLDGFSGAIAKGATELLPGDGGNAAFDPFRNEEGDIAERALMMMHMIREAETAEQIAKGLKGSAVQAEDAKQPEQAEAHSPLWTVLDPGAQPPLSANEMRGEPTSFRPHIGFFAPQQFFFQNGALPAELPSAFKHHDPGHALLPLLHPNFSTAFALSEPYGTFFPAQLGSSIQEQTDAQTHIPALSLENSTTGLRPQSFF